MLHCWWISLVRPARSNVLVHPLERVPSGALRRWQWPSLFTAAACLLSLPAILPLRESHTLFELVESGTVDAAAAILDHWSAQDRARASHAVGLDYLMNPAYMNVLAISCIWAGRSLGASFAQHAAGVVSAARWLAWLCWSVALTNAVENVGLFVALTSAPRAPWPILVAAAHYWAGLVVAAAVVFGIAGLMARTLWKPKGGPAC
jgi:hypothetical protein